MSGIVFSIYAVTGQNEGFAILWIMLVPLLGPNIVGLRNGFILSAYFQVFLCVLFYTPLSQYVAAAYTETFLTRFPILYFAFFGASTVIVTQQRILLNRVNHQAYYDGLTDTYNRAYYNEMSKKAEQFSNLTVIALDLNRLKFVNDTMGHEAGDKLICEAADHIRMVFKNDICCRTGGDEFIVISNETEIVPYIDALKVIAPDISIGYAARKDHPGMNFSELSKEADRQMYIDKAEYYKRNNIDRRNA